MAKFRSWIMHESDNRKFMAKMKFGQYGGWHHTQVPTGYLNWALKNISDPTKIPDADRKEIEDYLKNPNATPAQPPPPPPQRSSNIPRTDAEFRKLTPEQIRNLGYRKMNSRFETPSKGIAVGDEIYYRPASGDDPASVFRVTPKTKQPSQPEQPAERERRERPARPERPAQPEKPKGEWHCAKMKDAGDQTRIALKPKNPADLNGAWIYKELDPETKELVEGEISKDQIDQLLQFVKEVNGSDKLVNDPMQWILDDSTGTSATTGTGTDTAGTGAVTGNNYPDMSQLLPEVAKKRRTSLNEFGTKIQEAFLGDPNVPHSEKPNMVMNALAGTGKTTMLKHLATFMRPGEKWLYLVFNKRNGIEAKDPKDGFPYYEGSELPKGYIPMVIQTSHAFLGSVLNENKSSRVLPPTDIPRKERFKGDVISYLLQDPKHLWYEAACNRLNVRHTYAVKRPIKKIASLAKNYAYDPSSPDIGQKLEELVGKYEINTSIKARNGRIFDYYNEIITLSIELLKRSLPNGHHDNRDPGIKGLRDHDDTLWFFALNADQMQMPEFDVALIDEVQDFNVCQRIMMNRLHADRSKGGAGARVICVGDPNQAIYRFRGADANSFQDIIKEFGADNNLYDLPVNFRCSEQVIDYVNRNTHVNNLIAGKKANEEEGQVGHPETGLLQGVVTEDKKYKESIDGIISEFGKNGQADRETALICRNNKPLIMTALQLLKNNVKFVILGRDVAQSLVWKTKNLFTQNSENPDMFDLEERINNKLDEITNELEGQPDMRKIGELEEDKEWYECLQAIVGHCKQEKYGDRPESMYDDDEPLGQYTVTYMNTTNNKPINTGSEFIGYLEGLFNTNSLNVDDNEKDTATYKGTDKRKTVTLTTAHRSKGFEFDRVFIINNGLFNKTTRGNKPIPEEELQQEKNCKYVAYTRAITELHVINEDAP